MLLAQISHTYPATMCVQNCKKKKVYKVHNVYRTHNTYCLRERAIVK